MLPEYVDGAASFLQKKGYDVRIMPHAKDVCGSYAASLQQRLEDFRRAWADPQVKAVLCARGGYGAVQLLPHLDVDFLRQNAKWLIGYSDISALHAMLLHAGVMSLHAPMAKHLTLEPEDDIATSLIFDIIGDDTFPEYRVAPHPYNRPGMASGRLVGGNLAVINGLGGTPYDVPGLAPTHDLILFIEDISEAIYAVERMLYRMLLSPNWHRVKGLIIGRFTQYKSDRNFETMEDMISRFLEVNNINIPAALDFPVGHIAENLPMIQGAPAELTVSDTTRLAFTKK